MDPEKTKIFVGPPGTGKTRRLIEVMEAELEEGVHPKRIAFVAFTKKAAQVAKERAMLKFGFGDQDLPYFRTIHSLAFRQLGWKRDQVMQWSHYKELAEKLGMELRIAKNHVEDGTNYGMTREERLMFLEGLARVRNEPLDKIWREADEDEVDWWELERYARSLREYKKSRMVGDYTDMIKEFVDQGVAVVPSVDVLFLDEAQDLSPIQWAAIDNVASKCKRIYVAGDDDQALYKWAGADVNTFINLGGETTTLDQSYRIPAEVHKMAESISSQISNRRQKKYEPRSDRGEIKWYADPEEVDLRSGTWLLLARNGYMLAGLEEMCVRNGFSFESVSKSPLQSDSLKAIKTWESLRKGNAAPIEEIAVVAKLMSPGRGISKHTRERLRKADSESFATLDELKSDYGFNTSEIWHQALDRVPEHEREFFIAARKRGETLTKKPRITISTIHSAKGGEAENTLLMTDMSYRTFTEMQKSPDDEHRVFYVGATRCSQALHLVQPRTNLSYEM